MGYPLYTPFPGGDTKNAVSCRPLPGGGAGVNQLIPAQLNTGIPGYSFQNSAGAVNHTLV